jgi:RNA polymerase sigma-70 factor (ECF subfamily)
MGALVTSREPSPRTAADEELVESAIRGDSGAFAALVRKHERAVYGILFSFCGERAEAEDLAQETFVTAYRSLSKLREKDRFSSWVAGIAYRKGRAWRVRRAVRRSIWDRWLSRAPSPPHEDPSVEAGKAEDAGRIVRAIEELPELERAAIVLRIQQGLSVPEIARLLEITLDQARRAFERGFATLKQRFGSESHDV